MAPRTSPPMIASRLTTSPSTSPPFATSTCFAARTVPTTVPSIFTTPSASMSPTTRIPPPMIERPATDSPPPIPAPFSVNSAISVPLLHQRQGIERLAVAPDLEMQMRSGRPPRAAGQSDHLPRLNVVAFRHEHPGGVSIHRLIPRRMAQEHELPVVGIVPCGADGAPARGADRRLVRRGDVDPGVGLGRRAGAYLAARHEAGHLERPVGRNRRAELVVLRGAGRRRPDRHRAERRPRIAAPRHRPATAPRGGRLHAEHLAQLLVTRLRAVERGRELLHAAVLGAQAGYFALQPRDSGRVAADRARKREEQDDEHGDGDRAPPPHLEDPERKAVLTRIEIAVGVDDDRDAAPAHPSNGAPRITSSKRARSSFE